jgi:hypothetical protein
LCYEKFRPKVVFSENTFVTNLAIKKLLFFFRKWFYEKSRSKEGFLLFSENGFVKSLALKNASNHSLKKVFKKISENGFLKTLALKKAFYFILKTLL